MCDDDSNHSTSNFSAYDVSAAIYIDAVKWCTHSAYAHHWKCYSILPLPTHTYVCSLVVPTLQTCLKVFRKLKIAGGRWHLPKPEETRTENLTENTGRTLHMGWQFHADIAGSLGSSVCPPGCLVALCVLLEALVTLCVLLDAW